MRGAVPLAAGGLLTGALVPVLPAAGLLLVAGVIGLGLLVGLVRYRADGGDERTWHPIVMVLTGAAVVSITWNGFRSGGTSPPDLLLLAALAAVGYCWFQGSIELPLPGWLLGAAGLLVFAQLLNEFFLVPNPPVDPPPSYTPPGPALLTMARFDLAFLVVPIVIGAVASSWRRVNLMANLWLLSATISAAIATFDGVTGASLGATVTGVRDAGRAAGLTVHPNHLALVCSMTLPLALVRVVQLQGRERLMAITSVCFLILGGLVSGSRIGLFSLVVAVALTAILLPRLRARVIAVGVTAVVLMLLVGHANPLSIGLDRLSGGGDAAGATEKRTAQLEDSFNIALDHPVTGVGFTVVADAHSLPLQFWETAGFAGILAILLYTTGVVGTGLRLRRDRRLPRGSPEFAAALIICYAVWLIAGLLENQIAERFIYVPVGLLLGLALTAKNWRSDEDESEPDLVPPPPAMPPVRPAEDREAAPVG